MSMERFVPDADYILSGQTLNLIWKLYLALIEDDGTPEDAITGDRRRDMATRLGLWLERAECVNTNEEGVAVAWEDPDDVWADTDGEPAFDDPPTVGFSHNTDVSGKVLANTSIRLELTHRQWRLVLANLVMAYKRLMADDAPRWVLSELETLNRVLCRQAEVEYRPLDKLSVNRGW